MNLIPPDFAAAIQAAGLEKFFSGCTPAHQREYLKWIGEAKKPATRAARIGKSIAMMAARHYREARKSPPPGTRVRKIRPAIGK